MVETLISMYLVLNDSYFELKYLRFVFGNGHTHVVLTMPNIVKLVVKIGNMVLSLSMVVHNYVEINNLFNVAWRCKFQVNIENVVSTLI